MDARSVIEWNNRGAECLRKGRHREAVRLLAKAADACPPLSPCHSNFLMSLLYQPGLEPEEIAAAHQVRIVGERLPSRPHPHRRLRIAYLTPDFHFHPKAFLQIPQLRHFDRERFELYIYSSTPERDEHTRLARSSADRWRDVAGKPADYVARRIRSDAIDVLIDITGHFARSPLPVFALGAAPVQISIPGYPATTGLPTVDYKLVDSDTDPLGMTEHLYCEELLRLRRSVVCYSPPSDAPDPGPAPVEKNGYITFGSFNNRPKLNGTLFALWSAILRRLPTSRLLIHHTFDGYPEVSRSYRDPIAKAFRAEGISSRRLQFVGAQPVAGHLDVLGQADIALDSFPYHGVTTTCECLWMGVPVVTLAGKSPWSRSGVSILNAVGLGEWICKSPSQYVRLATAKALDPESLCRTRAGLREQVRASEITDGQGWIRSVEEQVLAAWLRASRSI